VNPQPGRLITGADKVLDQSKLKVDSDKALDIARPIPF
jgi:hypothetical protein